jgi:SAM-dependent methyltransferase
MTTKRMPADSSVVPLYDSLAHDYDRFVNWKARLDHELPFLTKAFTEHGVERILDAACGTGHHAIALAQEGYRVTGTDLSAVMIEKAVENAAKVAVEIPFVVRGLGALGELGKTFDAVLCLGNSLPHLQTASEVNDALSDFRRVLRPGGVLVIQNRNFDRVWVERERFMPPQSHRDGDEERLFLRFYDFHLNTITFNMIRLWRRNEGWEQAVESTELRPILSHELHTGLVSAGFGDTTLYGGYDQVAFDPKQSHDLITVSVGDLA